MDSANKFLNDIWKAVKITFDEFQAGPKQTKTKTQTRKFKPKWTLLKREKTMRRPYEEQPRTRRKTMPLKYEYPAVKSEKVAVKSEKGARVAAAIVKREIKVERAILMKHEPIQLWEQDIEEKDSGINAKIESAHDRVKQVVSEPTMKLVRKNRQFYEAHLSYESRDTKNP